MADNDSYDVVIIGSGSSGIGAAIELRSQSKFTYILLEARDRIGGRAYTDQHSLSFPFDVGAQWIHEYGPDNPLYKFHEQLKTELDDDMLIQFFSPKAVAFYDLNGSTVDRMTCYEAVKIVNRFFSHPIKEKDMSLSAAIQEEYDKLEEGQLKQVVKTMLTNIEEILATDLDQLSARLYLNKSHWSIQGENENNLAVKRGYGFFIQRLANHYHLPVALNTVVTKIDTHSNPDTVHIFTSQGRKFTAKYVIVTVPLGCLKEHTITFQPPLPQWKLDAIDQLGFGYMEKIIIEFDRVFWNDKLTVMYLTGAPFPVVFCNPDKRALAFMIGGRRAQAMSNEKDEITLGQIMDSLKKAFPNEEFKIEHYIISRWSKDEFARGSYSYYSVHANQLTMALLAKECAEDRLYWAGEHTSNGSSVHTAFATGQREAKKIFEYHSQKI